MKVINKAPAPPASVVISLVPKAEGGHEVVVENNAGMPDHVLATLVRGAADELAGVDDREKGTWGRMPR